MFSLAIDYVSHMTNRTETTTTTTTIVIPWWAIIAILAVVFGPCLLVAFS